MLSLCTYVAEFANGHPDDEDDELSVGDTRIVIEDGELLAGMLDKKTLGTCELHCKPAQSRVSGPEMY